MEPVLVISRVFDAPRALGFRALSTAEHLARWWGPAGFTIHVMALEFRAGGTFHYRMTAPDGFEMWGKFYYREIVEPRRIVWVNTFSDPEGGITRAPFGGEFEKFPLEVLTIVTLDEQDDRAEKTLLTIRAEPINAGAAERETFMGVFDSMQQGYGGTLDQLAAHLAGGA
jgi:uncharacterized protein YndB with AHSA1/START domain